MFIIPRSIIEPCKKGIKMNGIILPVTVYNVTRYYRKLWLTMKAKSLCPANKNAREKICTHYSKCIISYTLSD
jgi:hypothetical protein